MPETTKAIKALWSLGVFVLRGNLAELFVSWALKMAPKGYKLSFIDVVCAAYRKEGEFANIKGKGDAKPQG